MIRQIIREEGLAALVLDGFGLIFAIAAGVALTLMADALLA